MSMSFIISRQQLFRVVRMRDIIQLEQRCDLEPSQKCVRWLQGKWGIMRLGGEEHVLNNCSGSIVRDWRISHIYRRGQERELRNISWGSCTIRLCRSLLLYNDMRCVVEEILMPSVLHFSSIPVRYVFRECIHYCRLAAV